MTQLINKMVKNIHYSSVNGSILVAGPSYATRSCGAHTLRVGNILHPSYFKNIDPHRAFHKTFIVASRFFAMKTSFTVGVKFPGVFREVC